MEMKYSLVLICESQKRIFMKIISARVGDDLKIKNRKVDFSFWPIGKRASLQSTLFITDPWLIINQCVVKLRSERMRKQASYFLQQAEDFYNASLNSNIQAAKPLLQYYCFLNLAKCFSIYSSKTLLSNRAVHGLSVHITDAKTGTGHIKVQNVSGSRISAFRMFSHALHKRTIRYPQQIVSDDFFSQIVVGHRVFCQAQNPKIVEKFINLEEIHIKQDKSNNTVWLLARASKEDFKRLGYIQSDFAKCLSYNQVTWRNVSHVDTNFDDKYFFAQTVHQKIYIKKPSAVLNEPCQEASFRLWRIVTSYPPYRKYYIYFKRDGELLMHQLLSIYLATFYFGHITRYQPEEFHEMLEGLMGAFIHEFFANQPNQFLYLMASEFMEQEVSKAAIV